MNKEHFKISRIRNNTPFSPAFYILSNVKTNKCITSTEGTKNSGSEVPLFLITSEYLTYDKR